MQDTIQDNKLVELNYKVIDEKTGQVLSTIEFPLSYVHGADEVKKFAKLPPAQAALRRELARIANETLMPSAAEGDFHAWSRAVHQYNRSSGMLFAPIQGGPYNGPTMEALIEWLQQRGVTGVGQSSWGPGVFAWFESREHAEPIVRRLPEDVELITVTHVRNEGRLIEENG